MLRRDLVAFKDLLQLLLPSSSGLLTALKWRFALSPNRFSCFEKAFESRVSVRERCFGRAKKVLIDVWPEEICNICTDPKARRLGFATFVFYE